MRHGLLQRLLQGGGLSLVKLVCGLAKIKLLAWVLGVEGLGFLSLALQFQATAVALVSMSLAVGVINLGRPAVVGDRAEAAGAVVGTAVTMVALNAVLLTLGFAWWRHISDASWFLHLESQSTWGLWPVVLAAVVAALSNVLWEGLAFLVDRFDAYVRTQMLAALADALLFASAAWWFGLAGALVASLLGALVLCSTYAVMLLRLPLVRTVLSGIQVQRRWAGPLLSYSVLMLLTTAVGQVCILLARGRLTAVAGEAANGYLQVVTALAAYLLPFVMTGVWGHLHPAAAASGDTAGARAELRRTLVASLRIGAAGCIAVVTMAPLLVPLVYSRAFEPARPYLAPYFAGELCFMALSVLGAYLLAVGRKHAYFLGFALYHGLLLAGVWRTSVSLGPWAYVLSHVLAALFVAALATAFAWRGGLLDGATLASVAGCMAAAALCSWLDFRAYTVDLGQGPVRWSWLAAPLALLYIAKPYLGGWRPGVAR